MQAAVVERVTQAVGDASAKLQTVLPEPLKEHSTTIVCVAGGSTAFLLLRAITRKYYRSNPFKFGRTGALEMDEIGRSIDDYEKFFDQKDGRGVQANQVAGKAKSNTPEFVDKFYRCAAAPARTLQRRGTGTTTAGCRNRSARSPDGGCARSECTPALLGAFLSSGCQKARSIRAR